jgi:hypothetical protein
MNKSDKDTFDGLLKVAEFSISRFDQRRNHSWKISLGFWAAILGSATLLDAKTPTIALCPQILGAASVLILHTYWLAKVFGADKQDRILAFRARDIAIQLLNTELQPPPLTIEKRTWYRDWGVRFQILTTILLLSTILYIVNLRV